MKTYHQLVRHVLAHGTRKENRTGVDTLSTFFYSYQVAWEAALVTEDLTEEARVDLLPEQDSFPLLTTKTVSFKNILVELLWFLSGSKSSEFLERHGCKFWRPWYNEDGTVKNCYGPAWRKFDTVRRGVERFDEDDRAYQVVEENDQVRWLVNELKRNPMSRRLVVSSWAPGIAQTAPLPPCHAMWVVNVQNVPRLISHENGQHEAWDEPRLCLHLTQRSGDVGLGIPYNVASYALLLLLLSRLSGIKPGVFAHTIVDAHIYCGSQDGSKAEYDHVPELLEQLSREVRPSPRLVIDPSIQTLEDIEHLLDPSITTEDLLAMFRIEGYTPHPPITLKPAV